MYVGFDDRPAGCAHGLIALILLVIAAVIVVVALWFGLSALLSMADYIDRLPPVR